MHRISIDFRPLCKGYPLGMQRISIDFRSCCKGYPLRNALDFHGFTHFLQGVALGKSLDFQRFPSILQGVPLRNASDFYFRSFCKGYPLEIHQISLIYASFARGALGNASEFHRFPVILQGVPLRNASDFHSHFARGTS
jgi:hypothetical protein